MLSQDIRGVAIPILIVGIISSILYLWGYWHTFGIVIFEYANIQDIVTTASIITFLSFGIFATIGLLLGTLTSSISEMDKEFAPGAGRNTKIGQFLWRYKAIIFVIYIGILAYAWVYMPLPRKTIIFPWLFIFGFGPIFQHTKFLSDIKDYRIRNILIYLSLFMIPSSYLYGKLHAQEILDSKPATFYEAESKRKYLGHTNGYFFFLSPDNSKVFIIRSKSLKHLVLDRVKKPPLENQEKVDSNKKEE